MRIVSLNLNGIRSATNKGVLDWLAQSGADLVYLITCPERACRYQQGNERAWKRVRFARKLIEEIGLDPERLILEVSRPPLPQRIDGLIRDLLDRAPDKGQSLLRRL